MMTRADRPAGGDALPEGFRVRPAGLEDATAVTALVAASQEELHGEAEVTRASMLAKWQAPRFDLGRDAWLIETATGVPAAAGPAKAPLVVAFGAVRGSAPGEFAGNLAVHPRFNGRGLGPYLLARIEGRVRAAAKRSGAHSAVLHTWSSSADAPLVELYLGAGFERVAVFSRMEKDLETGLQDPAWPSGIESRAFRRGKDELTVYTALAEAFGEDDDDLPDAEEWARNVVNDPRAEPALWLLAWEDDVAAGAVVCSFAGGRGIVERLAVRPAWQGRGIGGALLRAAFQVLYRRGATEAVLAVQLGVAVEALDLYRRAGMTEVRRIEYFEKRIAADAN